MILDTDILIDLERKHPAARAWFAALPALPLVSGLAAMELKQGCRNAAELRTAEKFLSVFDLAWPTEEDMERAYAVHGGLKLSHNVGLIDCLIGMTASGLAVPVATLNRRHFEAIPGVSVVTPYTK